ncbi:MAG: ExbD/TolR family protein [Cytophagaceae bacterium]
MAEVNTGDGGGKKKGGKVRSKKVSTKIDMTPMVDLAFLLITFFMLTTTFNKPKIMEVKMPVKDKEKNNTTLFPESETMTVILGEEDKVYYFMGLKDPKVETTDYSDEGIRKIFLEKRRMIPKFKVIIKAKETSRYKNMVDILDDLHISGVEYYSIGKITPKELDLTKKVL